MPYREFGQALKAFRRRRGFTLADVVETAAEISHHPPGRISQPYLSQLEAGRKFSISLTKLITLAAIYAVDVTKIIEVAPREMRPRLQADLKVWRAAGAREPRAVTYLPKRIRLIERLLDGLLAESSVNVVAPVSAQASVMHAARRVLIPSILASMTAGKTGRAIARDFWQAQPAAAKRAREAIESGPGWPPADKTWRLYGVYLGFAEWAICEAFEPSRIAGALAGWTILFEDANKPRLVDAVASCQFEHGAADADFGYKNVPALAALGARWRQTVNGLCTALPGKVAAQLDPRDGVLDFIVGQVTLTDPIPAATSQRLTLGDLAGLTGSRSTIPALRQFVTTLAT